MSADTLRVTARRWAGGWELHIDGHGVTQCRTLDTAQERVRDYVHTATERPCDTPIQLDVDLGGFEQVVRGQRAASEEAASAQIEAAAGARAVVAHLREMGLSVTDSAAIMGVSRSRISQLMK